MSETVKNVGGHPIDLADGRPLGPGDTAPDVPLGNPHNKDLLDNGMIAVVQDWIKEDGSGVPPKDAEQADMAPTIGGSTASPSLPSAKASQKRSN